jgi:hypothetical protein
MADIIAPLIEDRLRREIGASSPVPYVVERGDGPGAAVGGALARVVHAVFGGRAEQLFVIAFDVAGLKPFQLHAGVDKQGLGARVGVLLYSAALAKPIAGEAELEVPLTVGRAKFAGDAAAAGRLNARVDLLKRVAKFSRTNSDAGGVSRIIPRLFRIVPQDGGALLLALTLGRPGCLGFSESLDAREFADLAAAIEAVL